MNTRDPSGMDLHSSTFSAQPEPFLTRVTRYDLVILSG